MFAAVFVLRILHRMQLARNGKMQTVLKRILMSHLVQGEALPAFKSRERAVALTLVQEFSQHIESEQLVALRHHLQSNSGAKYVGSLQTVASYSTGSL